VVQIETSQRTGRDPDNLHKKHRSEAQSDGKKVSRFRQEMKKSYTESCQCELYYEAVGSSAVVAGTKLEASSNRE